MDTRPTTPEPAWRATTWYGGHNNAQVSRIGHVLAVNPSTAAFHHRARVRQMEDGTYEGYWYDDGGRRWMKFLSARIAAALYEQAVAEERRRNETVQENATPEPAEVGS